MLKSQNELLSSEGELKSKPFLSSEEAAKYLNLSRSYLFKLTSGRKLPHYKPNGKRIYFKRTDLDEWALKNRQSPIGEIEMDANNYIIGKGGKHGQ